MDSGSGGVGQEAMSVDDRSDMECEGEVGGGKIANSSTNRVYIGQHERPDMRVGDGH